MKKRNGLSKAENRYFYIITALTIIIGAVGIVRYPKNDDIPDWFAILALAIPVLGFIGFFIYIAIKNRRITRELEEQGILDKDRNKRKDRT
jgi:pilus assembly protein TadC